MKIINIFIVLFLTWSFSLAQSITNETEIEHHVKYGETLWHLSKIYNIQIDSIKKWNNIDIDSDKIIADKTLIIKLNSKIDEAKYHIVKEGEYLVYIASMYKLSVDSLIKWNDISNNIIYEGELLYLSNPDLSFVESKLSKFFYERKQLLNKEIEEDEFVESKEEEDFSVIEKDSIEASYKKDSIQQEIITLKEKIKANEDWLDNWMQEYNQKNKTLDSENPNQIMQKLHLSKRKSEIQDSIELQIINLKTELEFCEIALLKEDFLKYLSESDQKQEAELDEDTIPLQKKETNRNEKVEFNPKKIAFSDAQKLEVVVFDSDVSIEDKSKKDKKKNKLIKQIESENVDETISLGEVTIKDSRKEKYKIGDKVDEMSRQKSEFYLLRAKKEIDNQNFKKANNLINKSITINPSFIEAYMIKGDLYALFDFYDKALENYEKAKSLDRALPQIYYNIGNCLLYQGKSNEALTSMRKAISLDSTYVLGYYGRSIIYLNNKIYDKAIEDFNKILELNAYFFPAVKGRGIAHLNNGDFKKAIVDFNTVLNFDVDDEKTLYLRGLAKLYLNNLYEGCLDLLKASEMGYNLADKDLKKYCN